MLSDLNNANPLARLNKTVTIEKGTVDSLKKLGDKVAAPAAQSDSSAPSAAPGGQISFLDQIKQRIATRFVNLHP